MALPANTVAWGWLLLASVCEVAWAIGLKQSAGFTRFWPSVITALFMIATYILLAFAMKHLPASIAYPIWTGLGAVGVALIGMFVLREPASALRFVSLALIVAGIIGLKWASGSSE
ncbi:MAG: multidrug efflux SMR transporter [Candidatus Hydrogenedentes bacterium]|nr:multidrug efflux SMR transporter [Candidatus Hydrogenedentota bacterium]